jgi:hypothetical protein
MSDNPEKTPNGWPEWGKYVLKELERLNDLFEDLRDRVSEIDKKLTEVRVRVENLAPSVDEKSTKLENIFTESKNNINSQITAIIKDIEKINDCVEKNKTDSRDLIFGLEKKYVYITGVLAVIMPIVSVLLVGFLKKWGIM